MSPTTLSLDTLIHETQVEKRRRVLVDRVASGHRQDAFYAAFASVGFLFCAVFLANADSLLANWASAILFFLAFLSACLWMGESGMAKLVSEQVRVSPADLSRTVRPEDARVIREYGRVLERNAGKTVIAVHSLPFPKHILKSIILGSANSTKDQEERQLLEQGYFYLSYFQPHSRDPDLILLAEQVVADELEILSQEWKCHVGTELNWPAEPPRVWRRLLFLRRWSHEQVEEVLARST